MGKGLGDGGTPEPGPCCLQASFEHEVAKAAWDGTFLLISSLWNRQGAAISGFSLQICQCCSANLCEVFGAFWENRKGFLTGGAGRVWKDKIPPPDREFLFVLRRSPVTSQPPVSRVNLQGRCGVWGWLPGQGHTAFIAQFCSQLLSCPLPAAGLGSSCKTHRRQQNSQAPNIVILIVWFGVSAGALAQEMNMILV